MNNITIIDWICIFIAVFMGELIGLFIAKQLGLFLTFNL